MSKEKLFYFLYYVLLTAVLAYLYRNDGITIFVAALLVLTVLAVIYIALMINIITHELGHLIGGLFSGYKFLSFRIFNIILIKSNGKLIFRKFSLPNSGGECIMEPPELINGTMKYTLFNLAGSLSNLIIGGLFLMLAYSSNHEVYLDLFLKMTGYIGLFSGFYNVLPIRTGVIYNDGRYLAILKKNPQAVIALWFQSKIAKLQYDGVRLKDMNSEWFFMPSKEELQNPLLSSIGVSYASKLMDEENFVEAHKTIDELLNDNVKLIPIYKKFLQLDKIFLELMNGNTQIIESLYDDKLKTFSKKIKNLPTRIRTEYAIALLHEKDEVKAKKLLIQFEKVAKTHPYTGDTEGEKELIDKITKIYKK